MDRRQFLYTGVGAAIASAFSSKAVAADAPPKSLPPHRICEGLYYVGNDYDASYLVPTRAGNILINTSTEGGETQIPGNVRKLGFKWEDTKIILISHAHFDHCAGSARVIRETHAQYAVMDADVKDIEDGGHSDFAYAKNKTTWFPPTRVNRVLHDGEHVELGGVTLVAYKTAGHTRGCTTWTMRSTEAGKPVDVVIVGSPNVNPGFKLVHNTVYPQIADDYRHGFAVLESLPCDVFLGAHGMYYGLNEKYPQLGKGLNPFIDPNGYRAYVADRKQAFEKELAKQQAERV